jgi:hypothetical protein
MNNNKLNDLLKDKLRIIINKVVHRLKNSEPEPEPSEPRLEKV